MKWRYMVGYVLFIGVVVWGCSGCTVSKTNIEYQCFTKAACDEDTRATARRANSFCGPFNGYLFFVYRYGIYLRHPVCKPA
jgi:hypothetical protein